MVPMTYRGRIGFVYWTSWMTATDSDYLIRTLIEPWPPRTPNTKVRKEIPSAKIEIFRSKLKIKKLKKFKTFVSLTKEYKHHPGFLSSK